MEVSLRFLEDKLASVVVGHGDDDDDDDEGNVSSSGVTARTLRSEGEEEGKEGGTTPPPPPPPPPPPSQPRISSLNEGTREAEAAEARDDPRYAKYHKMIKMGVPVQAVRNKMKLDGVDDTSVIFL